MEETIENLLQEQLNEKNLFLVNKKVSDNHHHFRFFIDGIEGVTIGDCAKISRKISNILDELMPEDNPFRFEISSPGADEPLVDKRQYFKHIGRKLNVQTLESEHLGVLKSVEDHSITLSVELDKKKKTVREEILPFENIKESKVVITFK